MWIANLFLPGHNESTRMAHRILSILGVKVTVSQVFEDLLNHPDFPSLLSLSDVLNRFGVETLTVRVSHSDLNELPLPFAATLTGSSSQKFVVVTEVTAAKVAYYQQDSPRVRYISREGFLNDWDENTALLCQAADAAGDRDFAKKRKAEKLELLLRTLKVTGLPMLTLVSTGITYRLAGGFNLPAFLFTLTAITGYFVCVLLVLFERDEFNPTLQKICPTSGKVNCSGVLQSRGAKIFGTSWSVLGLTYFSALLILQVLFGPATPSLHNFFLLTGVASTGFIVYSIYYQSAVVKQWCVLCLAVIGILFAQLAVSLLSPGFDPSAVFTGITVPFVTSAVFVLLLCFTAINSVSAQLFSDRAFRQRTHELQKLKHNKSVFTELVSSQPRIDIDQVPNELVFGDLNASNEIILVCGPFCSPCSEAHRRFSEKLAGDKRVRLRVVFAVSGNPEDKGTTPAAYFLAIARQYGNQAAGDALHYWYGQDDVDLKSLAAQYPLRDSLQPEIPKLQGMWSWCDNNGIVATPTIFFNGFLLPELYSIDDLAYQLVDNG